MGLALIFLKTNQYLVGHIISILATAFIFTVPISGWIDPEAQDQIYLCVCFFDKFCCSVKWSL